MTEEDRTIFKVLSFLLQYPEAESLELLEDLRVAARAITDSARREPVTDFLAHLQGSPLIRLQEDYTATFDLSPPTSLNLTYHRWGEGKERGSALARLVDLYAQAGYEIGDGELPDYLPLVLEFLSVGPPDSAREIMAEYRLHVGTLASRLAERRSPYAALVEGAAHLFAQGDTTLTGG
ncbi:MAG TPA: nitrate reductase molybdenum cofactor assembly chaperone [Syntrophobacteria bacterium]|nr:nitrate reductase molybdenum cofactor assembly chaperone [Syntrophobacteria bacterium]